MLSKIYIYLFVEIKQIVRKKPIDNNKLMNRLIINELI